MKKIKMSDILLTVCAIAIVCGIGSLTLRGKKTTEKLIIGDWYQQWSDSLTFSIYDDGTVGKWLLVNDNQLILSDFYGETIILKIENIDADNMEVRQVIDGKESQESITFWHTADGAQTIRVKGYH